MAAADVQLTVANQPDKGYVARPASFEKTLTISLPSQKTVQLQTTGPPLSRASVSALWGPKALENLVHLDFELCG